MKFESSEDMLALVDSLEDGWCAQPQPALLYSFSKRLSGRGEIVEIGSFGGKSTIALAFAQQEKQGRVVHAVDIAKHPNFDANVNKAGVGDYVSFTESSSSRLGRRWSQPIELLWVDGGHDYACVLRDIKLWIKHVVPGGFVLFHDYPGVLDLAAKTEPPDGVSRALRRTLLSRPWEWRVASDREAGSIIAFQRLGFTEGRNAKFSSLSTLYFRSRDVKFLLKDSFSDSPIGSKLLGLYRAVTSRRRP